MAVALLIESEIALKPEGYRGSYSQRGKHPWPFLAGRSHDDSERLRILSDAVRSLPRPHGSTSIGPRLTFRGISIMVEDAPKGKGQKALANVFIAKLLARRRAQRSRQGHPCAQEVAARSPASQIK